MLTDNAIIIHAPCIRRTFVTVQTVPCTPLHGIGANKVTVSGHPPLAEDDLKWADAVTVHARRV